MDLSWQLLNQLAEQYGDSFYLLDLNAFRGNYREFLHAFRSIYPKTSIAYSYKTNYIPRLCSCVNEMDGIAEVVSLLEYELAIRIGVPPRKIIFNGPYKDKENIEKALLAGSTVNLDSQYEVEIVRDIAGKWPEHKFSIGLRCNFDFGTGVISRFGFDIEDKTFETAVKIMSSLKNCRMGLHCHFSTSDRSIESYAFRTRKMLELAASIAEKKYPEFIDLGGGYFGKMGDDLIKQYPFHVPNYGEYAEAIASQFADLFKDDTGPELILEPGMAVVADVIKFAAKVIDVKTVRGKKFALAAGSIHNIKPSLHTKNLPAEVVRKKSCLKSGKSPAEIIDIVGYTCMEHDYLYKGFEGPVDPGDFLVFENTGAYTIVLKPPFIQPCPAIIAFDSAAGIFEAVKRAEKFDDVFATYVF